MAVVKNFWLRDNTQKLGGAVIYQSKGQTLMRQLAPSISNPRTDAQMEQRVKLANLVAFYRASASWMRGAFETKPTNQSDYNAFVSANAASNAVWLTKSQVDAGTCIVAPYTISRGSLGEIRQSLSGNLITSNLYVGDLTISATTTVGELSAALLANNNGITSGDQLSIIQYIQNTGTDGNYTIVCRAREVIINTASTELLSDYLPVSILAVTTGEAPALAISTSTFMGGAAFVLSRTTGGRILVSSSVVTLTPANVVYNAMTTTTQKETAIRSYGTNTTVFLDSQLAQTENSSVYTPLSIVQVLGVDGNAIAQNGALSQLSEGDTLSVVLSKDVQASDLAGARLVYSGWETFVLGISLQQGSNNRIVLLAQDDVEWTSEAETMDGLIEVTIGTNTLTWPIQTYFL